MEWKKFPKDFIWGVATSAYQIEGAYNEDDRGETIWDRYCSIPGNVLHMDNGNIACDHYHRYKDDIQLMKNMGIKAYRFSVAWSRIFPKGKGKVNQKGLDFYVELVDGLLKAGIEPVITLYHWDLPQALQDIGGWSNPDLPVYFLEYAKVLFEILGGKVKKWITLNEPYCAAFLGNYEGRQAPGNHDFSLALRCAYYMYVGHGMVVDYFKSSGLEGEIGIALNLMGRLPYSSKKKDVYAAKIADGYLNRWFLDPLVYGKYPQDMVTLYESNGVIMPEFDEEHLRLMSLEVDFIGLNYYNDFWVKSSKSRWPLGFVIENPPNLPVNDRGWPVTEQGFKDMLLRLKNEYNIRKIYITENGTSFPDVVTKKGTVEDGNRKDYMQRHISMMQDAIEDGAPVKGYFYWSLYDNFEWSFGYTSRFGIVFVDFESQKRIIKQSGHWYSDVIKNNAVKEETEHE